MSGFDQREIRVKLGQPITIRLTSLDNSHHTDGGGKHLWAVDELAANVVAEPESSNYVTFTPEKQVRLRFIVISAVAARRTPQ